MFVLSSILDLMAWTGQPLQTPWTWRSESPAYQRNDAAAMTMVHALHFFCALSKPDHFFNLRINPPSTIDRTLEKWTATAPNASQKLIANWQDHNRESASFRFK
jgi:glucose dehydrogenase